ncbi:MAG: hypothetical protein R3F43_04925 [bacterium]
MRRRERCGRDGCAPDCTVEPRCGDGVLDAGEACDDGNGRRRGDGQRPDRTVEPRCGDGVLDAGEAWTTGTWRR